MTWGSNAKKEEKVEEKVFGIDHYREMFARKRTTNSPIRMSLTGKENTAKTGSAVSIAREFLGKDRQS